MNITVGDEPILDRGFQFTHYHPSEDEIEDHRSQRALFIGVHMPPDRIHQPTRQRRRRHKKPKQGQHDKKDYLSEIAEDDTEKAQDPSQHVMFLLGEDEDEETHNLFCEMDELRLDDEEPEWKETARWIKFEEDVEEGGERWSKPHVASLSLYSLFEVRNCISSGVNIFNMEASNFEAITEVVLNQITIEKKITPDQREKVKELLHRKHIHLHERRHKSNTKSSQLPLIRSLADIGKKYSSKEVDKDHEDKECPTKNSRLDANSSQPSILKSSSSINVDKNRIDVEQVGAENVSSQKFDLHFFKKIPHGAETSNIMVGETDFLNQMVVVFVRLKEAVILGDLTEVPVPTRFLFILLGPQGSATKNHEIGRSMATLMSDDVFHDVAYKARNLDDLLAGIDEFLSNCTVLPPAEWDPSIRIEPPKSGPIARKVPTMPNGSQALMSGSGDGRGGNHNGSNTAGHGQTSVVNKSQVVEEESHCDPTLRRTGRLFGGLIEDIKRKAPFYLSDIKDAFHVQCFASFFFLYFACLTPIITFGGLLVQATGGYLGAIESLLSGTIVGVTYALFSGQPLTIMGSTGPVLVFESIVYQICERLKWEYLPFRLWIGIWIAFFLLLMVAFDLSALVRYITRFTEESFAALIALIFMVEAFKKLAYITNYYPVDNKWDITIMKNRTCDCVPRNSSEMEKFFLTHEIPTNIYYPPTTTPNVTFTSALTKNITELVDWEKLSSYFFTWDSKKYIAICKKWGGQWSGPGCNNYFIPDVFFFSCLLFIGTFTLSYGLKMSRNARFFPNWVRSLISDFAVMIAISSMTILDMLVGFHTPKLDVPVKFEPTLGFEMRPWIIPAFGKNPWWTIPVSIGPALLAVILIFMDQQITAVIVNRKENKLKKGCGYHLDLLIVAILILVNSILGIPWFVAATVLSINHVMSLKKESENTAPGERPVFLGCREQRVTGTIIFLVIGLSVFLTPLLKRIPMPVLYGVFLFMGVASLRGVQLMQRISLFFMPAKYQPDYIFLRYVPLRRVHFFTLIQISLLVLLWVIKSIKALSIFFPVMVLALCFVRKGLEYIFTYNELKWLDDILPDHKKPIHEETELDHLEKHGSSEAIKLAETKNDSSANKIIRSNDSGINISEEMGKTAIWKSLSGGSKNSQSKNKKRKKREHNGDKGADQDAEAGDNGYADNNQPLLNESGDNGRNVNYMMTPEIVVNPPSARESPELKHHNVTV